MKRVAAVNFGESTHILDHIAPLAYCLQIPLFVNDEKNFELLKKFYPQVKVVYEEEISFDFLAKNFDALVSCKRWNTEDKFSFVNFYNKDMKIIFCPHGNSDKGHINKANMLGYATHDAVMLYGNHMIDLLKKLNVYKKLNQYSIIGNFRLSFYKKFKEHYNEIIRKQVFSKLNPQYKTILYAPTWNDLEDSSSFFEVFQKLIKKVPDDYNLIVKLHPHIEERDPVAFYQVYENNLPPNILLLEEFPLVYPLLNSVDVYLGDFSSIGYDFIYFQKPMFFFDHHQRDPLKDQSLFLHRCGTQIPKGHWDNIFTFIQDNLSDKFKEQQMKIYDYAFGKELEMTQVKENFSKVL